MTLVEQLFRNAHPQHRWGIKFLCFGLGGMFAYDFYFYADAMLFKRKAVSIHFELMFTRPLRQTPDMIEQHQLLNTVADLVDQGRIRTTATTTLAPISPTTLREAHELVENGRTVGKVTVHRWE